MAIHCVYFTIFLKAIISKQKLKNSYLFLIFVVVPSSWESSQRHPDTLDTAAEYLMLMKLSVSESGGWSSQEFDKV